jgi:acyl-CoA thioesterase I
MVAMIRQKLFLPLKAFFSSFFRRKHLPFVYVAIGDSTARGVGASHPSRSYTHILYQSLKQQHKKAYHHNLGVSGARIREVIVRQLDEAIAYKPDLVTISVGANDIRHRTRISSFQKDLRELIDRLQTETTARIVINNIPDFSTTKAVPVQYKAIIKILIERFNKVIELTAQETGIIYIDLHTQSRVYNRFYPEIVSEDDFHPSDFGYAIWANTIITTLLPLLLKSHPAQVLKPRIKERE